MGTQHLDIPVLPSPLTIVTLALWICLIVGLSAIWSGTTGSTSRFESRGSAFRYGVGLIVVFLVGYWFLYSVLPYFVTASKAVLH